MLGEIIVIFLWNEFLYYQYSLPQHMAFSDFQILVNCHIKHTYLLRHVFVYTWKMIHRDKSNWFSIVHRRRTSWPFPIDCSLPRTFKWHYIDSLYHRTAFSNQVHFTAKVMLGEIIVIFLWNEFLYYQYSLPQHMAFCDFQKLVNCYIKHTYFLRHAFVYTWKMIHRDKSNWFSIVHRRRTSWPFPRRTVCTWIPGLVHYLTRIFLPAATFV